MHLIPITEHTDTAQVARLRAVLEQLSLAVEELNRGKKGRKGGMDPGQANWLDSEGAPECSPFRASRDSCPTSTVSTRVASDEYLYEYSTVIENMV